MRSIIRHLTPLFRSRRRFSFLLVISLLLCVAFILFNIDRNNESIDSIPNQESPLILTQNKNNLLNKLYAKITPIMSK